MVRDTQENGYIAVETIGVSLVPGSSTIGVSMVPGSSAIGVSLQPCSSVIGVSLVHTYH
jgi:hypothetical protein